MFLAIVLFVRGLNVGNINELFETNHIIHAIFMGFVYLISIELVRNLLLFFYRKKKKLAYNEVDNFTLGIRNVFILLYVIGFVIIVVTITGVQLTSFIFSVSIVAAALAITLKEHFADIISSMLMTFSSEIEVGDRIKFGDYKGVIQSMNLSKTSLLTDDDDLLYIPNSKLFFADLINYTKRDIKKASIGFELANGTVSDLVELEQRLVGSIIDFNEFIVDGTVNLRIVEVKKDYSVFKFQYILKRNDVQLERAIRREVVRCIYKLTTRKPFEYIDQVPESKL